ncbi:hypothetical protein WME97_21130 [Sorangium sp. So ce367]
MDLIRRAALAPSCYRPEPVIAVSALLLPAARADRIARRTA